MREQACDALARYSTLIPGFSCYWLYYEKSSLCSSYTLIVIHSGYGIFEKTFLFEPIPPPFTKFGSVTTPLNIFSRMITGTSPIIRVIK